VRVLVSSTVGYGHVFPMVPLARALVAAGHDLLWATGEDTARVVKEAGLNSAAAGATMVEVAAGRVAERGRAEGLRPEEIPEFVFPRMFGGLRAPRMLADLLPIARAFAPDLLRRGCSRTCCRSPAHSHPTS
jgi:UDP:flavonoid glycosyltransferase YjiC (YdhE family)